MGASMVPILDPTDFSKTVRERRKALGLTQRELALASGVGRVSVLRLENEPEKCQLRTALRIAEVLGLNLLAAPTAQDGPLLDDGGDAHLAVYTE